MATTTQTMASSSMGAAALTLVGTNTPTSVPIFCSFRNKPRASKMGPPGRGSGVPSRGGGPLGGGGPPGGSGPSGSGDAKLGGKPPREFNGDCAFANTFMN